MGLYIDMKMPEDSKLIIPWIYADLDTIIDSYSEPPKEELT